jgi:hypothetical protein
MAHKVATKVEFNGVDLTPHIEGPIVFTDDQGQTMTYTNEQWDKMSKEALLAADPKNTVVPNTNNIVVNPTGNLNTYTAAASGGIIPNSTPTTLTFQVGGSKTLSKGMHDELIEYLEETLGLPIDGLLDMRIEASADDLGRIHLTYLTKPLAEAHAKRHPPIAQTILSAGDPKPKRNDRKTSTERG